MIDPEALSLRLAERLAERGDLGEEAWRRAVERVPRHLLVPRFSEDSEDGGAHVVDGANPEQREEWLRAVYDPDRSLVTERDPATGVPTSSATMPSIVLALLERLDLRPGHRVLEVGTGSGYRTALLCERVGSANVTTIDIGAEVVRLARRRLAQIGYRPHLVCGDGFEGHAARAPYDRVLAMVGLERVPRAWVEQTRPGGIVVATLPTMTARLERGQDGSARGPGSASWPCAATPPSTCPSRGPEPWPRARARSGPRAWSCRPCSGASASPASGAWPGSC
jgi:protein-L-isoaspartate O-methyltransferase